MADCTPTVSVVIPAYNRAHTLGRALDSVLAQTFGDFELIVVDDASTDDTVRVAEATGDPRVRVLRHETNRRAAAARNTGIRAARGKYVAFLDSDDEWLPEKLHRQVAFLEGAAPDMLACCTAFRMVDGPHDFLKIPRLLSLREMYFGCDLGPGTTLMVRRDVFDGVGVNDESLYRYEDWDWSLRYARRYRMGCVAEPLAIVHRGPRPPAAPTAGAAERLLEVHAPVLAGLGRVFTRRVCATRWVELAEYFYRERNFSEGTRFLLRGILIWPLVRPGLYVLVLDAAFDIPLQRLLWRVLNAARGRAA
ncbi:MAG: glycosyltransferase [Nitrospirota bacterium]|nr:glycosyltransferase [Nitrospirota bacterium]